MSSWVRGVTAVERICETGRLRDDSERMSLFLRHSAAIKADTAAAAAAGFLWSGVPSGQRTERRRRHWRIPGRVDRASAEYLGPENTTRAAADEPRQGS